MEHISIEANRRSAAVTKGERKRLRRAGHIPAAVFGKGIEPVLVTVEAHDLAKVLGSEAATNTLIDLSLEGARHLVKLTEVDIDPITRIFLHVGLHKIAANESAKSTIPVEIVGEPADVHNGMAILETGTTSVEVKCLPEDQIATFTLDVSDMKIGDVRHVSDLPIPANMELLTPLDAALVSLHVAKEMVEEVQETVDQESAQASPSPNAGAAGSAAST